MHSKTIEQGVGDKFDLEIFDPILNGNGCDKQPFYPNLTINVWERLIVFPCEHPLYKVELFTNTPQSKLVFSITINKDENTLCIPQYVKKGDYIISVATTEFFYWGYITI